MMEFVAKIVKESLKKFLSNTPVADASSIRSTRKRNT